VHQANSVHTISESESFDGGISFSATKPVSNVKWDTAGIYPSWTRTHSLDLEWGTEFTSWTGLVPSGFQKWYSVDIEMVSNTAYLVYVSPNITALNVKPYKED